MMRVHLHQAILVVDVSLWMSWAIPVQLVALSVGHAYHRWFLTRNCEVSWLGDNSWLSNVDSTWRLMGAFVLGLTLPAYCASPSMAYLGGSSISDALTSFKGVVDNSRETHPHNVVLKVKFESRPCVRPRPLSKSGLLMLSSLPNGSETLSHLLDKVHIVQVDLRTRSTRNFYGFLWYDFQLHLPGWLWGIFYVFNVNLGGRIDLACICSNLLIGMFAHSNYNKANNIINISNTWGLKY